MSNIVIEDKKDKRKEPISVVEDSVKQIQDLLKLLPKTSAEVAGYLKAHGAMGDHSKDKNPVANFARSISQVFKGWAVHAPTVTADREYVYVEFDEVEGRIPLPEGLKQFARDFGANALYHYLYNGRDTECVKLRDSQS